MTRETKLGLGVGVSFLSLVAVVAFNAWNKTDEPQPAPYPTPGGQAKVLAATGAQPQAPQAPANEKPPLTRESPSKIQAVGLQSGPQTPPSGKPVEPVSAALPGNAFNQGSGVVPPPVPLSPASTKVFEPPALGVDAHRPGDHNTVSSGGPPDLVLPGLPSPPKVVTPEMPLPTGPVAPFPGADAGKSQIMPQPPPEPVGIYQAKDHKEGVPSGLNEANLPVNPGLQMPPGTAMQPPTVSSQMPPVSALPKSSDPGLPEPMKFEPRSPAEFQGQRDLGSVPPVGTQGGLMTSPIPVTSMPQPTPVGINGQPNQVAALVPGAKASKPLVTTYDEKIYKTQDGDTDFAALSRKFYGTDKWAKALEEHNRTTNAQGSAQTSPLMPGSTVFVPPLEYFEQPSAKSMPGQAPSPQPLVGAPGSGLMPIDPVPVPALPAPQQAPQAAPKVITPPSVGSLVPPLDKNAVNPSPAVQQLKLVPQQVQAAPPPVAVPNDPGQVPLAPGPNQQVAAAFKLYTVPQGGQKFHEIARDTLGNNSRWNEIYSLNPQFDPLYAVPAGTQLKLPADARVVQ